jgi:hypothetical protein
VNGKQIEPKSAILYGPEKLPSPKKVVPSWQIWASWPHKKAELTLNITVPKPSLHLERIIFAKSFQLHLIFHYGVADSSASFTTSREIKVTKQREKVILNKQYTDSTKKISSGTPYCCWCLETRCHRLPKSSSQSKCLNVSNQPRYSSKGYMRTVDNIESLFLNSYCDSAIAIEFDPLNWFPNRSCEGSNNCFYFWSHWMDSFFQESQRTCCRSLVQP